MRATKTLANDKQAACGSIKAMNEARILLGCRERPGRPSGRTASVVNEYVMNQRDSIREATSKDLR